MHPRLLLSLLLIFCVSGCALTNEHRGNLVESDELSRIKPNKDDIESVRAILGSPTITDRFRPNEWLYAYQHTTRRGFFHPETVMFKTVRLTFNKSGTLTKIATDTNDTIPEVIPVPVSTKTSGHRSSVIQGLFGNFGNRRHKK